MPNAPASACLLRLSALGDVTHVVPLVRTLQAAWPAIRLTWVIGKGEHRLLAGLPGVDFVEYDKKTGLAGMRALRRELRGRLGGTGRFDVLLQMQVAARANLLSAFIPARRRTEKRRRGSFQRAAGQKRGSAGLKSIAAGLFRCAVEQKSSAAVYFSVPTDRKALPLDRKVAPRFISARR